MDDMKRTSEYRRMLPFIAKASNDVGVDTQGQDIQALLLSLSTHKSSADHDGRYYTETETNGLLSYKADKSLTLTAGDGLTGGGTLAADRTFAVGQGFGLTVTADAVEVNLTSNFTWTGGHTFSGSLITGSILPSLSDVYDLGDYTKPWRKIWGSELSAVVFSQYEQVLLGGWLTISKGEGKLEWAIGNGATQAGLGSNNFVNGDILVFRGISSNGTPQVEYMQIGSLVIGTIYNVTRNLDGTGANDWPDGTVYGNWGQVGNGRVELNAYDTPRMSVYSHGAAIADFREQLRFGDLNGGWGYSSSVFGGAFGAYESGKANITIDPVNGLRIRNYNQDVIKLTGTIASFEQFITLGVAGGIRQGTGTWVTPPTAGNTFTGTALWAESSVMNVGGWNAGAKQWWGGSDGILRAGAGAVALSAEGVFLNANVQSRIVWQPSQYVFGAGAPWAFYLDCVTSALQYGTYSNGIISVNAEYTNLLISSEGGTVGSSEMHLKATGGAIGAIYSATIDLYGQGSGGQNGKITYTANGGHTFVGPVTIPNAWTSYTPSLTNAVLGNGTIIGRIRSFGNLNHTYCKFTLGSTSSISGDIGFSVPVTVVRGAMGLSRFDDVSAGIALHGIAEFALQNCYARPGNTAGTYLSYINCSSSIPFVWAAGDVITINTWYES